jgi:hypothetical protein
MRARVVYASKTGNTARIARAMAAALGVAAEDVGAAAKGGPAAANGGTAAMPPSPGEKVDLLLIGGAVYATFDHDVDPGLARFVAGLDPRAVARVAFFATGFPKHSTALAKLRGLAAARGLKADAETFFSPGGFLWMNFGRPNKADQSAAAAFALARAAAAGR